MTDEERERGATATAVPGLITRQRDPENLEMPFSGVRDFLTPVEQLYVRSHFDVPHADAATWRISIEGAVQRPFEIAYDELCGLPSRTLLALLECSGNGRLFLSPPEAGLPWELGAVGNIEWTGTPLWPLLERAGVEASAREVVLVGADQGEPRDPEPSAPGPIAFARSLPLEKASRAEVLLAHRMNGQPLTPRHGFPVRAVVAGWYAMASVKWLRRIVVVDRPFQGYFQTFTYSRWERRHGLPSLVPVGEFQVKAQIARPAPHERVRAGSAVRVHGTAWSGDAAVTRVELSTDGGASWLEARLLDEPAPYTWRRWEITWQAPSQPGQRTLMARATDARGRTQPMQRDRDRRDGMISHVLPIEIDVG